MISRFMRNQNPILIIEDNDVDVMLFNRALNEIGITNEAIHLSNGEEALEYLKKVDALPSMIFLDLNMPVMNGFEFLEERLSLRKLMRIPVIVFTSSNRESDRAKCFEMAIAGYMVKPSTFQEYREMLTVIDQYWTFSYTVD